MSFTEKKHGDFAYMTAPNILATHAFTTRLGGAGNGIYASLNLGLNLGDDPAHVRENYNIVCRALGITDDDIVCSRQVHGTHVRIVTREDCGGLYSPQPVEADGLITSDTGVALAVFTADCVPILLHDAVRGVAGAVHAGWRGTSAGIVSEAVYKMRETFGSDPADIRAAIGPCISKCCFETGPEVLAALRSVPDPCGLLHGSQREKEGSKRDFYVDIAGVAVRCGEEKYMVDLKEANRLLLVRAGVAPQNIMLSDECTMCRGEGKYWSHRLTKGRRGSQSAVITLKGNMPK